MLIERMESRRLLAVTVAVDDNGVLAVTGDDADNFVGVFLKDEDTLVVRTATVAEEEVVEGDDGTGAATLAAHAGRMGPIAPFDLDDVTTEEFDISDDGIASISIDLAGGDDRAMVGHRVELDAVINGGAGDDKITGGAGDDTISGGDDNDHVRGGPGADNLNGDAGNDSIDAADGVSDVVDGGSQTTDADGTTGDIARIDAADGDTPDTVTDVESTRAVDGTVGFPRGGHRPGGPGFGGGGPRGGHRPPPAGEDDGTDEDTGTDTGVATSVLNTGGVRQRPVGPPLRR